jgi:PLD-like domain
VAVPFFGKGGAKLLPLQENSVLVVRCDESSVRAGLVDPSELLQLSKKKVRIHSCENLHAKVFVFGRTAIVGSANVSRGSSKFLIEAGLETTDHALVAACRSFVDSLRGDEISEDWLRKLVPLYRPPRLSSSSQRQAKTALSPTPQHSDLWAVKLRSIDYDDIDKRNLRRARQVAYARQSDSDSRRLDDFVWYERTFLRRLRVGHRLLACTKRRGGERVAPLARVLEVRRYRVRGALRGVVIVERPRGRRERLLSRILLQLGPIGESLRGIRTYRLLRSHELVLRLGQLWPLRSHTSRRPRERSAH